MLQIEDETYDLMLGKQYPTCFTGYQKECGSACWLLSAWAEVPDTHIIKLLTEDFVAYL